MSYNVKILILLTKNWTNIFQESELLKTKNENLESYSGETSDKKLIEYYYPIGPLERSMKVKRDFHLRFRHKGSACHKGKVNR